MKIDKELQIRPMELEDLPTIWTLIFKENSPEWKEWDAPYFPHQAMSFEEFVNEKAKSWLGATSPWVITVKGKVCGTVSYYYEDDTHHWLEMGIVIHEALNWCKGIGSRALKLWMDHLFQLMPIERVGITTWSGNTRMIRVAEKLGLQVEGRIRKVRYHQGTYYDSIRMGILRDEWLELRIDEQRNEWFSQGLKLRRAGNLKESNQYFLELMNHYPENASLHYQCAWSFDVLGEEARAVPFYEKAIQLGLAGKELEGAFLGLGSTYRSLGDYHKSNLTFLKGIELFPENEALKTFYAMTLYNLKDYQEAMNILLKCLVDTTIDEDILRYRKAIMFYADKLDQVWN